MTALFHKNPAATLDYSLDWSGMMEVGEAITATHWSVMPEGADHVTIDRFLENGLRRGVSVRGGRAGYRYRLVCRVETDHGRVMERALTLRLQER
ncbi:phage fiber-tail adaptor protein [Yunchengibacter salinarum]|uniref:phage fiber-tail adaptor protein n=1 Tax=Yunchengibacter salinarum TaxID=3133399 RepID=UPI0035B5FCD4